MSIRSVFVALAALAMATPVALRAQTTGADFARARQQFVAGQARPAAQTLLVASLVIRQEIGRSHDEVVGMRLVDAEGQLEKLAAGIRAGTVDDVKALDRSLTEIDRLLARHHLQLASAVIAKPKAGDIPVVVRDIDRAAFHFERSITLNGRALAAEQSAAVADVRTLAKEIEDTKSIPNKAAVVVATLEKLVIGSSVVTAAR